MKRARVVTQEVNRRAICPEGKGQQLDPTIEKEEMKNKKHREGCLPERESGELDP